MKQATKIYDLIYQHLCQNLYQHLFSFVSYFSTLYFFEIIYFMIPVSFIYGRNVSIIAGITFTLILSVHIIRLYFNRTHSRTFQICLMDIHLAYSVPYYLFLILMNNEYSTLDYVFISVRLIICLFEILLIYLLTDERVIKKQVS